MLNDLAETKIGVGNIPDATNPLEQETQNHDAFYRQEIGTAIDVNPDSISFVSLDDFLQGRSRFLFGFTPDSGSRPASFLKLAKTENTKLQLRREIKAMEIAHELDIPVLSIHSAYTETSNDLGVVLIERLTSEKGTLLANDELVAGANPEKRYGARAAKLIARCIRKEIPKTLDSSMLVRDWKRTQSAPMFWQQWEEQNNIIMKDEHVGVFSHFLPLVNFQKVLRNVEDRVHQIIAKDEHELEEFYVQNDNSPSNMFFINGPDNNSGDVLLDFEQVAATRNPSLGFITDVSDFYNRAWANSEMQRDFLQTFLELAPAEKKAEWKELLVASVVFGTGYAASLYMEPNHFRHKKAVVLLQSLEENINFVESLSVE